jgi:hypothetical protein
MRGVAANVIRPFGKHHSAEAGAARRPSLNLDDHFGAFLAAG